ncbi:unnamed protein product [Rangifer tarandus platyrhynchus]|uniref:Uncharacterized protein n=1 Tax=Rangifer tarandus platyrhynchus TaxID=3082113 RepID=A0AC59YLE8_RANTA
MPVCVTAIRVYQQSRLCPRVLPPGNEQPETYEDRSVFLLPFHTPCYGDFSVWRTLEERSLIGSHLTRLPGRQAEKVPGGEFASAPSSVGCCLRSGWDETDVAYGTLSHADI